MLVLPEQADHAVLVSLRPRRRGGEWGVNVRREPATDLRVVQLIDADEGYVHFYARERIPITGEDKRCVALFP